jgi:membrane associated rhomboid family serine protease
MDEWTKLIDPKQVEAEARAPSASGGEAARPAGGGPLQPPQAAQESDQATLAKRGGGLRRAFLLIFLLVSLLWALEAWDSVTTASSLDLYGIHPRTAEGLRNIAYAPFLHANFAHLSANTLPLIVLGLMVMLTGLQAFAVVSITALVTSGLGVWLFGGSDTVHLGASGVIFGYLGFLLAAAWFQRSATAVIVALVAVVLYGGMLWGVLPGQEGVSWLGHLFGLAGGVAAAWFLRKKPASPSKSAPAGASDGSPGSRQAHG